MNDKIEQAANRPCPECGGQRVITKYQTSQYNIISTGILSGTVVVPVSCVDCGYTALYTDEPDKVRKHYLKQ
ncbi:hypothetical protein KDK_16280 [Dictyobacter kobayashii]|uniref:Uncharacterized protein n=1 Tax=Dictyobacter kobayashii TaxID=2014872 RepID=A0A402AFD9_9CHLR|nr:hypothetical protein KDK_16280 [Dictyobacter kobayashii]